MKKKSLVTIICLILFCFCFSCKKDDPIIDTVTTTSIKVDVTTIKENYYIEEFDISSIYIIINKSDSTESRIPLEIKYVVNSEDLEKEGFQTIQISYDKCSASFQINLFHKEQSTSGLEFSLNDTKTAYVVSNYKGIDKVVNIPSTYNFKKVVGIDLSAFENNQDITKVNISEGIERIADNAFKKCKSLIEVKLPRSLKKIGESAFEDCINLSLWLPQSIQTIESLAFYNLRVVYFESSKESVLSNTKIGKNIIDNDATAIYYDVTDTGIVKEGQITYVLQESTYTVATFIGNIELNVPEKLNGISVVAIGDFACTTTGVTSLITTNGLKKIGRYAFRDCDNLANVKLANSIEFIDDYAFSQCILLKNVEMPSSLKSIGSGVFSACRYLESALFYDGIESIGTYCFQNCYSLSKVYIPSSCTFVGMGCFYACRLAQVYIGKDSIPATWDADFKQSATIHLGFTRDEAISN